MSTPSGNLAPPLQQVLDTCQQDFSPSANIFLPGSAGYIESTTQHYYWASSELQPAFVLQPGTPNDVSITMQAIAGTSGQAPFAIKGGGHFAIPGTNSTNGGILIDLALLNKMSFNTNTKSLDVGPGQIWDNVYNYLEGTGYNVAGATTCANVGVAGFNLGGGFGNKTNRFGLAIDNINSVDMVLPSGQYIQGVNTSNQPDLFWALRGGGNNFGIVTNWNLPTHVQPPIVYSKTLHILPQYFPQLIVAIYNYGLARDKLANVEAIFEYTYQNGTLTTIANIELYYDGPAPPPGLFDAFLAIPYTWEQTSTSWVERQRRLPRNRQTYAHGRPNNTDDLPPFRGRYSSVMVSSFPQALIQKTLDICSGYAKQLASHSGLQIYPDFWPFMPSMYDNSPPCAWPHSAGNPSGPLVINFKWTDPSEDDFWLAAINAVTDEVKVIALGLGVTTLDTPAYYNLALGDVQASAIYQGNLERLSQLRTEFDPQNVMGSTGGFRIPLASTYT